jgi:aldehyde dehydrogenase (NAD+)
MINEFHYNRVCDLLKDHGGEVVMGNKDAPTDRNLKITIILNPRKDCAVMQEEIFGPIFPVFTYNNFDEVINYVTEEQEKPLVSYYFGARNGTNAKRMENETSSGALLVNDTTVHLLNLDLPFGGVGFSG